MRVTSVRFVVLIGSLVFPVIALSVAVGYVAFNDWFGANDVYPFAYWSLVMSLPAFPVVYLFDRWTRAWSAILAFIAAIAFGTVAGLASTVVVAVILGPWINAFSFPVFYCWLTGALACLTTCVVLRRPRMWPGLLPAVAGPVLAVIGLFAVLYAQPDDLVIHIESTANREQVESIYSEVLSVSHPSGRHTLREGIRGTARTDTNSERSITVSFWPGTSEDRRAEIKARVRASPFVSQTSDSLPE